MTKQQRAAFVGKRLAELYPQPPIPLDHKDPYTLLIAVLLSAQCTDKRVNLTTPALFALADNPAAMAKLTVAQIDAIVRPCGLAPRKAEAIHRLSELLLEHHNGEVPADMEALEELPGVGHKTASVVMAQAFGVPSFPVDTHIHRLAERWKLSDGRSVTRTEADLKALFPRARWNPLHLQIIYYGREHCSARGCDGHSCEICSTLNGAAPAKPQKAAKKQTAAPVATPLKPAAAITPRKPANTAKAIATATKATATAARKMPATPVKPAKKSVLPTKKPAAGTAGAAKKPAGKPILRGKQP